LGAAIIAGVKNLLVFMVEIVPHPVAADTEIPVDAFPGTGLRSKDCGLDF
jgi:hypothetical protein